MDYSSDLWLSILTACVVNQCTRKCILECPGCNARLKNPILHLHEQLSLLEKLRMHFDEVRGILISTIYSIYDSISHKLPHSPDLNQDKEHYCNNAISFLSSINPDALYWGRYLDENNDILINDLITSMTKQKRRIKSRKTSAKKNAPLENLVQELLK